MSKKQRTTGLYEKIRAHIEHSGGDYFRKETLAARYGAREHEVSAVLHKLNLEGLISQPIKRSPFRCCTDWRPDVYKKRGKEWQ